VETPVVAVSYLYVAVYLRLARMVVFLDFIVQPRVYLRVDCGTQNELVATSRMRPTVVETLKRVTRSTAGCHIRREMTGVLGNHKSFSASGEPLNVASKLRQRSIQLST
jgi:hypothetical protein